MGSAEHVRWTTRSLIGLVVLTGTAALVVPSWRPALIVSTLLALDMIGAILGLRAARKGTHRTGWLLVSVGRLAAIGAVGLPAGQDKAGALCGLLMYGAYAAGALAFGVQRLHGRQRAALAGEALTVLGCGFMYLWYFVLRPHLGQPGWEWPLLVGFAIGDLLVLMAVTVVVMRGGLRTADRPTTCLIAGLALLVLADATLIGTGHLGDHAGGPAPATAPFVVGALLMTLAAGWAGTEPGRPHRPRTAAWFSYLPYAAVGAGLTLMVAITLQTGQLRTWGGLVLGLVVMTAGVAARQIVSLRDSREQQAIDPLTGLANLDGIARYARRMAGRHISFAAIHLDVDGFKHVNDTYGLGAGDRLLLDLAHLLRMSVRQQDLVARVGGDEFVVLQHDVTDPADAETLARRIQAAVTAHPLRVGEQSLIMRTSIGIALSRPDDGVDDLRRRCDVALYHAKRAGQHGIVVYEPGMLDRRADDDELADDLDRAVAEDQLRVVYQPMTDLATGRTIGFEALVRWQHPTRGLISPLDFIPLAERTGAIAGIGLYVLEQACGRLRTWHHEHNDRLYVSVNVSPSQLQDPATLHEMLAILDGTGLPPEQLVLEVTESAIVDDRTAIPTLEVFRSHGIRIAIDDFGTGYSSLQYLTRLPVDILKIDRAFVAELDGTRHGGAIAEAVIRLAQILDLTTVAEGIETVAQADELRRLGCNTGQGYLYAKPLSVEEANRYLEATAYVRT